MQQWPQMSHQLKEYATFSISGTPKEINYFWKIDLKSCFIYNDIPHSE